MLITTNAPATRSYQRPQTAATAQSQPPEKRESEDTISTQNAVVSAAAGLAIQLVSAANVIPFGTIGTFIAGAAIFAASKGVWAGYKAAQANKENKDAFKNAFTSTFKEATFNGLIHSSIQQMAAGLGPAGFVVGPALSGALTKFTGF